MELELKRTTFSKYSTIGELYVDGKFFCYTLEDEDLGLYQQMGEEQIKKIKVAGRTCIPYGRYEVVMNIKSNRFSQIKQYAFCNGYLPRLVDVPGWDGVLIHIGNWAKDTEGCILVGTWDGEKEDWVSDSKIAFNKLMSLLEEATNNKEKITITVKSLLD